MGARAVEREAEAARLRVPSNSKFRAVLCRVLIRLVWKRDLTPEKLYRGVEVMIAEEEEEAEAESFRLFRNLLRGVVVVEIDLMADESLEDFRVVDSKVTA